MKNCLYIWILVAFGLIDVLLGDAVHNSNQIAQNQAIGAMSEFDAIGQLVTNFSDGSTVRSSLTYIGRGSLGAEYGTGNLFIGSAHATVGSGNVNAESFDFAFGANPEMPVWSATTSIPAVIHPNFVLGSNGYDPINPDVALFQVNESFPFSPVEFLPDGYEISVDDEFASVSYGRTQILQDVIDIEPYRGGFFDTIERFGDSTFGISTNYFWNSLSVSGDDAVVTPGSSGGAALIDIDGTYHYGGTATYLIGTGNFFSRGGYADGRLGRDFASQYLSSVPEPNSLCIFGLTLVLAVGFRKKKCSL
ncbi:MAG: PEP-CTERM sorting domain-containing protein [Planctomycetota bacterium]